MPMLKPKEIHIARAFIHNLVHISHFACPPAPYLIFNSSLKRSFKRILLLYWKLCLMFFHSCERVGYFPHSFHHSYTTLIPKGPSRSPLSLRPITVLTVPYRIYASLRCQTLLEWQTTWVHSSQYAFCKGKSTTSLNSNLSFDLLSRYTRIGTFAGIQFDFAKCFDPITYSVIWDVLS